MSQPAPQKFTIPCTTIGAARKTQAQFVEALATPKAVPSRANKSKTPVGIKDDLVAVIDKSNRQGEAQLSFGSLVEFTAAGDIGDLYSITDYSQ